ncbi:hypothetical protein C1X61_09975 [Pseudomonas sp. FW215-T2]|nr:hypothetical protein C1X61_09975 [Pseudomonas sp. FW215-T2]
MSLALRDQCGSELARDSGGSVTVMLNVPPSSRASSLPQGIVSSSGTVPGTDTQWLSCSSSRSPVSCRYPE